MRNLILSVLALVLAVGSAAAAGEVPAGERPADGPIQLHSRRELFVDQFLIDNLTGVRLVLHHPRDEGPVLQFDKPWEGPFSGYATVIRDGEKLRLYYRGKPTAGGDGDSAERTCCAESKDGIRWTKPELGLFDVMGTRANNVVLAGTSPASHNFSPFLDARPGVPEAERFKALAGLAGSGLLAFVSGDGLRWRRMQEKAVLQEKNGLDSQNVSFWSQGEGCYVCYFRTWVGSMRTVSRATSKDFIGWTKPVRMTFGDTPLEQLYTNQTHPCFRAPHIYLAIGARFMPDRQVISAEEARTLKVDPGYYRDCSDAILMSSRGGNVYERAFMESFIRPGIGLQDWVSRTNYPVLNVVQTGPAEMSVYTNQDYAQPTAHLRRYSLRLDGFASVQAPHKGGELLTKPLTFEGSRLYLNFSTSAAGGIRVEVQDAAGKPVPGYSLADARETIGNEIERAVSWKQGPDLAALAGKTVRLRFVMKDADLYALRFGPVEQ